MRIAYLEDDPAQATQICEWLADAQYDCHHYDHGAALLRALHGEAEKAGLDPFKTAKELIQQR